MATCPTCDRRVDRAYDLPPEVVTRDLIETFDGLEVLSDLEICIDCLDELMEGSAVVGSGPS